MSLIIIIIIIIGSSSSGGGGDGGGSGGGGGGVDGGKCCCSSSAVQYIKLCPCPLTPNTQFTKQMPSAFLCFFYTVYCNIIIHY